MTFDLDDVVVVGGGGVGAFPLRQAPSYLPTPIPRDIDRSVGPGRTSNIYTVAGGTACGGTCITVTSVRMYPLTHPLTHR